MPLELKLAITPGLSSRRGRNHLAEPAKAAVQYVSKKFAKSFTLSWARGLG
jgi:hypothetical protein